MAAPLFGRLRFERPGGVNTASPFLQQGGGEPCVYEALKTNSIGGSALVN